MYYTELLAKLILGVILFVAAATVMFVFVGIAATNPALAASMCLVAAGCALVYSVVKIGNEQ